MSLVIGQIGQKSGNVVPREFAKDSEKWWCVLIYVLLLKWLSVYYSLFPLFACFVDVGQVIFKVQEAVSNSSVVFILS